MVHTVSSLGVTKGGASAIKEHPFFAGFDWKALYGKCRLLVLFALPFLPLFLR